MANFVFHFGYGANNFWSQLFNIGRIIFIINYIFSAPLILVVPRGSASNKCNRPWCPEKVKLFRHVLRGDDVPVRLRVLLVHQALHPPFLSLLVHQALNLSFFELLVHEASNSSLFVWLVHQMSNSSI
jgi:hypothetical protein